MSTDEQLRSDVIDEINDEPMLHPNQIDVEVRDGAAFLIGQVESYAMRNAAEAAARRAAGSKVATLLSIKRSSKAMSSETWVDEVRRPLQDSPHDSRRAFE